MFRAVKCLLAAGQERARARGAGRLFRVALLLLLASQGLHDLRFLIAPGQDSGATLAGHADLWHLIVTGPGIAIVVALVVATLVVGAAAQPTTMPGRSVRIRRLWPLAAAALLAIYGSQELLEGLVGHGHEGGIETLTSPGGWVAAPLAVALGGLVALAVRVTRAADALAITARVRLSLRFAALTTLTPGAHARPIRPVLSEHRAGRAPPVVA